VRYDKTMIYDITRTIRPSLAVWPGDTRFVAQHLARIAEGAPVNLTTMTLSTHTGTHADAPYHYDADGDHPVALPLAAYIGPARVVQVTRRDGPLVPDDLPELPVGVERVLIRSHVSDLPDSTWPAEFPYLSVPLIEWLAGLGMRLIGLDSPSVDDLNSQTLPCHHALRAAGMVNLETLSLRDVPVGDYELIALPLKLDGVCASPVRAILRQG
jgi:arylformamidase